jgi:hypothetical protein
MHITNYNEPGKYKPSNYKVGRIFPIQTSSCCTYLQRLIDTHSKSFSLKTVIILAFWQHSITISVQMKHTYSLPWKGDQCSVSCWLFLYVVHSSSSQNSSILRYYSLKIALFCFLWQYWSLNSGPYTW